METSAAPNSTRWSRTWSFVEIVLIVGLIEYYLWFLKGTSYKLSKNLTVVSIVALVGLSAWRLRLHWPRKAALVPTWGKMLLGSSILAGIMLLAAWGLGVINTEAYSDFWAKIIGDQTWFKRKLGTVVAQQLALQLCLLPACVQFTNSRWGGILLAAGLFGLIHSPNPYLMLLTVFGGTFWCWVWLDTRRLAPLICSHLLLAVLAREYCNDALYNMRVGQKTLELFPVEVVTASGESFINDPMQFKGEWDVVRIEEDRVICRGWAADVRRRENIEELVVFADRDGKLRRFPVDGFLNEYVRESYGPKVANAGFEIHLPVELFLQRLRIYAYREGVGYCELPAVEGLMENHDRNPYLAAQRQHRQRVKQLAKSKKTGQQSL